MVISILMDLKTQFPPGSNQTVNIVTTRISVVYRLNLIHIERRVGTAMIQQKFVETIFKSWYFN